MQTINVHEAKTHLSRFVEEAARGNAFIIGKSGKTLVKVAPLSQEDVESTEGLGLIAKEISVLDDFDSLGATEIDDLFLIPFR
jgi:antitoxin (DNA-binding transcriptional repressor) of toxin-antitoxin stability system